MVSRFKTQGFQHFTTIVLPHSAVHASRDIKSSWVQGCGLSVSGARTARSARCFFAVWLFESMLSYRAETACYVNYSQCY